MAAGAPRGVAFYGGIESVFGTNPIAFGFPTLEQPVVFDMSTSAITFSGLIRAKTLGIPLPENTAIDSDGNPTTDPDKAIAGATLPFDHSYKGSGLGLVIELLCGPLTGAAYVFKKSDEKNDWGTFMLAFSPDLLGDAGAFRKNASDLVQRVKKAKTLPGKSVHIPGYDTYEKADQLLQNDGEIEINDEILKKLRELVAEK